VMVDTFKPLKVTEEALKIADEDYYKSWLDWLQKITIK
jgi:homogentisate 1,2-dioxygenase